MNAPYIGIIQEGGELPLPDGMEVRDGSWWRYCPECKASVAVDRLTVGYEFHMEHVTVECACCGAPILYFDVLMEANWAPPQLAAGS